MALHGQPYIGQAEPFVWAIARTMVRALFAAGHDTVVLDACNVSKARRDEWKSREWVREFHEFTTGIDVCAERARKSGRLDLVPIIDRMALNLEPVTVDEWLDGHRVGEAIANVASNLRPENE